jgi:sugar phosphate isomerase/epimerase
MFSASNLAWNPIEEDEHLQCLKSLGFSGLEIAPSKFIGADPYEKFKKKKAVAKAQLVREKWGLSIASMQSIWFGRSEQIFGSNSERVRLIDYSEKAFDFAASVNCSHIVFGNPKNRILVDRTSPEIALDFFLVCSDLAKQYKLTIGLEPIPKLYGNNFLTNFEDARNFLLLLDSPNIKLNYDTGTLLANKEYHALSLEYLNLASHIQISEPGLGPVIERVEFSLLQSVIQDSSYTGWISIEMLEHGINDFSSSLKTVRDSFSPSDSNW